MELCGLAMPPITFDGSSYAKLLEKGSDASWRNVAYSYFKKGISLKTPRYRITKYARDTEFAIELYDHQTDPNENENVAPQNPDLVNKLLRELEKGNTGLNHTSE